MVDQVGKTRVVAMGGILKRYIESREKERLTDEQGEEAPEEMTDRVFFGWKREIKRYKKV